MLMTILKDEEEYVDDENLENYDTTEDDIHTRDEVTQSHDLNIVHKKDEIGNGLHGPSSKSFTQRKENARLGESRKVHLSFSSMLYISYSLQL